MDILLKDVTEHNIEGKLLKAIKVVDEDDTKKLAKKIRKKQGYKTSDVKSQEQLETRYIKVYQNLMDGLSSGLARELGFKLYKAEDDYEPFKIKGKIFYSPKTGKPLTNREWRQIEDAVRRYLGDNTDDIEKQLVLEQQSLGTILQRLEAQGVRIEDTTLGEVKDNVYDSMGDYKKAYNWQDEELYNLDLSMKRLGNYITDINENVRKDIVTVLNEGIINGRTQKEISRDLLDRLGNRNRDWQRIVSWESQYNFQSGYLNSELKQADIDETVYVQAISQPDACKYCKALLNGKIYILRRVDTKEKLKDPYASGFTILGYTNVGRSPSDYLPVIPMHPYCRCRWVRWYPEFRALESPDPRVGQ